MPKKMDPMVLCYGKLLQAVVFTKKGKLSKLKSKKFQVEEWIRLFGENGTHSHYLYNDGTWKG